LGWNCRTALAIEKENFSQDSFRKLYTFTPFLLLGGWGKVDKTVGLLQEESNGIDFIL